MRFGAKLVDEQFFYKKGRRSSNLDRDIMGACPWDVRVRARRVVVVVVCRLLFYCRRPPMLCIDGAEGEGIA